jgi:chromosome segregation ATPase
MQDSIEPHENGWNSDIDALSNLSHTSDINSPLNSSHHLSADLDQPQNNASVLTAAIETLATSISYQRPPSYEPLLNRLETALMTCTQEIRDLKQEVSSRHRELSDLTSELHSLNESVRAVGRTVQEQEQTLDTMLSWKTIAANLFATSVIMGTIVVMIIKLTPSRTDNLLNTKLEIIFNRIEQIRKQTSPGT